MVCSRAELVFILESYFALKPFAPVLEPFSDVYPDKRVPDKTVVHRLLTEFWDMWSVCGKCWSRDKTAEIAVVPISSIASAATAEYGCMESVLSLIPSFCT
jgi:hypothetical protein